ncbi:hypothetical protein Aph01nite_69150 [Acrocarpospora phusangensis]|uniref:Lipoprotein n=1 Tax=Acrocarpospora phusangensis TaxID=1070424 RepID=A0A919QJJ5_9ACTN|nr:hypothetical protein [Acrocarpospora phusangensis]GIH28605.1 hypothetical protein Aph01nite_69150 [Acrocarpospora phusangensis]
MTTYIRQAVLAVAVLSLAACSGTEAAAPAATVTVTAPAPSGPATVTATPAAEPTPGSTTAQTTSAPPGSVTEPSDDYDQTDVIGPKQPAIQGAKFQFDPGHDFTKRISPSSDGILRGRFVTMQDGDTAEYVPVRWEGGTFVGPAEGDSTAYAARLAPGVVYLSATGCTGNDQTINDDALGTERCTRARLAEHAAQGRLTAMITVRNGQITKVVEIYF